MLTSRYKDRLNRALQPLAAPFVHLGVSPSFLTLTGVVLVSLICLWFLTSHAVLPFCLAILAAGSLDALDGAVARASGRVTKFGSYLDAMCDRYVETIIVITVAAVTGYWLLSAAVLSGALLVSYAKARASMEVAVSNQEWPDLMERPERSLLYLAGLAAAELVPWRPMGRDLFWWTLLLIAVLTHVTVLQRVLRAGRLIRKRSGS
jgi:phosphatidylglycerophosphate synthase